jgi:hypothetical protein
MPKIVVNDRHGGFGLSDDSFEIYLTRKGTTFYRWKDDRYFFANIFTTVPKEEYLGKDSKDTTDYFLASYEIDRTCPVLVQMVEEGLAENEYGSLRIADVPDDVKWYIAEYDGLEWVSEVHRTW